MNLSKRSGYKELFSGTIVEENINIQSFYKIYQKDFVFSSTNVPENREKYTLKFIFFYLYNNIID